VDFHLYLANHHMDSVVLMEDLVRPIAAGLEDLGHHVASFSTDIVAAPRVNLFIEFFVDDSLVDTLLSLKQQMGDRFLFGVICTEDLDDPIVWQLSGAQRLAGLQRILPAADFVWTLLPPDGYRRLAKPERVARIEFGFSPRLVPPTFFDDPAERTQDVLIYGTPYKYRMPVHEAIRRAGAGCDFTIGTDVPAGEAKAQGLPRFLADEMLARAKVVIDMRRGTQVRALSVARLSAALHAGCAIVAEEFEAGETAWLYRYTTPAPYERIAETCLRLIREEGYIALGRQARERFRAETSMRDNMAAALKLPIFARLAGS
jgi:hypothetical protein